MTKVNGIFLKAQFEPTWASVVYVFRRLIFSSNGPNAAQALTSVPNIFQTE